MAPRILVRSLDLKLPNDIQISCADGNCPNACSCNNVQLCVPSTSNDSTAPTLSNTSYDAAAAGGGNT